MFDLTEVPATVKAADGRTVLFRYDIEGVIYARSKAEAQARIDASFIDHARIIPRAVQAETEARDEPRD